MSSIAPGDVVHLKNDATLLVIEELKGTTARCRLHPGGTGSPIHILIAELVKFEEPQKTDRQTASAPSYERNR